METDKLRVAVRKTFLVFEESKTLRERAACRSRSADAPVERPVSSPELVGDEQVAIDRLNVLLRNSLETPRPSNWSQQQQEQEQPPQQQQQQQLCPAPQHQEQQQQPQQPQQQPPPLQQQQQQLQQQHYNKHHQQQQQQLQQQRQSRRERRVRTASDVSQAGPKSAFSWKCSQPNVPASTLAPAAACGGRKTALSLKQVHSNSSVSTMAPEDWAAEEEEEKWEEAAIIEEEEVIEEEHETADQQLQYQHSMYPHQQQLQPPSKLFQHTRVPRNLDLANAFSKVGLEKPPTTMMIRNIPNRYTQRELIRELEGLGFAGSFDFFYAPIDSGTMGNVGYAFVNFVDYTWGERCRNMIEGYCFKKHQQKMRRKVATVSVAHLQGLQANIAHYENSAVNGRARAKRCGPVIMTSIASALTTGNNMLRGFSLGTTARRVTVW